MSDMVYWSVNECNRRYGRDVKHINQKCPRCKNDNWHCYWGVNSEYRSEHNPGEYIQYTCADCGYVGPELPS